MPEGLSQSHLTEPWAGWQVPGWCHSGAAAGAVMVQWDLSAEAGVECSVLTRTDEHRHVN